MSRRLLCISYRFPPEPYPLATRVEYILNHLDDWNIDAITAAENPQIGDHVQTHHVAPCVPNRLLSLFHRLRLRKLADVMTWPDRFVLWTLPAYRRALNLMRRTTYDAILVFMMPYSQGFVGVLLKRHAPSVPLILNLDDSPTCSGQNSQFPSPLHYRLTRWMEDTYVRHADAVVYVSRQNMERVRDRQPPEHRSKFHLVRWGSKPHPPSPSPQNDTTFRILYTGGTAGWYEHWHDLHPRSLPKRAYHAWENLGRYKVADIDPRTHGPVYVGRAIQAVLAQHPEWRGRIWIDVYGPRFPDGIDQRVLDQYNLTDIVHLHPSVPHENALRMMGSADLLFMALPARRDGSDEERISSKTYEYLTTDRPILAALPPGENRTYLQDKPGVYLTGPDDVDAMADVITRLADATFTHESISVNRRALRPQIRSDARAETFKTVIDETVAS